MNKKLYLLFLFVLIFRLFFAFQDEGYNDDNAYFTLRNVEHVKETGKPLFEDDLSYGGRESSFPPLYYYFLTMMDAILGDIIFKIVPAILFSALVFIVYFITRELVRDEDSALLATLISAFIPIFISTTLNNISILSAALFVMLLMIISLFRTKDKKYLNLFMGLSIILPLLHNIAFLFIISLVVYLIWSLVESDKIGAVKREAILFSIFIILIIEFLLFKNAFLLHGFYLVYQNTPVKLLATYFKDLKLVDLTLNLGILPLFFGIIGLVYGVIKRNDNVLLLSSMAITTFVLLILKTINFSLAIIFLGILLSILSSIGFEKFFSYIKLTKFSNYVKYVKSSILILVFVLLLIPSYIEANKSMSNVISEEELDALIWLRDQTDKDSVVMSSYEEGHFITGISKRKNVI